MERIQVRPVKGRVRSLSDDVVEQVLDTLFAGKLKPGQFLGTEAQLAEAFQTSRVPIREALGRLGALGVITIKTGARGGAMISQGDPEQFAIALAVQFMLVEVSPEEIFDLRIAIESQAAALAAERATEADVARIEELLEAIPTGRSGRRVITEKILRFHSGIVEVSGSRTLVTLMHAIEHALLNLHVAAAPLLGQAITSYPRLKSIVERIAAHDADGARQAMADHLIHRQKELIDRLDYKVVPPEG